MYGGRFGDTKIRNVDGEPSHVNDIEAHWIDKFGPLGELATKAVGSGTTNPKTGKKEYWMGQVAGALISMGGPLLNQYISQNSGKNTGNLESNMAPYMDITKKQEGIANAMIDPDSSYNLDQAQRIKNMGYDNMAFTNMLNNRNQAQGGFTGYSGIKDAQSVANQNRLRSDLETKVQNMFSNNMQQGFNALSGIAGNYQQMGEYKTQRDLANLPITAGDAMGTMGAGLLDYFMNK